MSSERLVIKVGTNVLTQPSGQLDYNVIHQMVDQIGQLHQAGHQVVLVTSGAVGAAKGLGRFDLEKKNLLRRQMMSAVGQSRLMQIYADFCREQNILPAQALLSRADFSVRDHYVNIRNVIEGLLQMGVLPIINENDVVASDALTFGDNDFLAAGVASMIGAHQLFILSTAKGFYRGGDPATNPQARLVARIERITPEIWADCEATLSTGGTGGMLSKLKAVEMATSFGVACHIADGKTPNVVPRILKGESLGTHFLATGKRESGYRQWLRVGALTQGKLVVDPGAEKALQDNKSLLHHGITQVEGAFKTGDIVDIFSQEEEKLGVGLVNFSAEELSQLIQQKSPGAKVREVIHRDRLLLATRNGQP